jgi:hypothetical protein
MLFTAIYVVGVEQLPVYYHSSARKFYNILWTCLSQRGEMDHGTYYTTNEKMKQMRKPYVRGLRRMDARDVRFSMDASK